MLLNGQNILNLDFVNNVAMINGEDYCLDRNLDANRQNAFAQYGGPITFSRGSQGTIVDSTGRISYAPNNLLVRSEEFDNAAWTKTRASVTVNSTVAPDSTNTADTLVEDTTASNNHYMRQSATLTAAVHTFSVYARAGTRSAIRLVNATYGNGAYFNLTNGTVGLVESSTTAAITAISNGWYRCSITWTAVAGSNAMDVRLATGASAGNDNYTGDGSSGVFIWGAQLEQVTYQTTPRAYIPTTTAAYYGPRFDYDPVTLAPNGLLIEEQRTNRILNSEDFTGAAWAATVTGTSTRVNGNTSSLGFMTGVITATSAAGGLRQQLTGLTSSQVYTISFYMQSTSTSVTFSLENGAAAYGIACFMNFNPSTGVIGTITGFTSVTSTPYRNGYLYRMILPPAGGQLIANLEWRIPNNGDQITIGRPQFEAGSFATSYIPTAASTVTRSAEDVSITGNSFSSMYNNTEGTLYSEASCGIGSSDIQLIATIRDVNNFNYIYIGARNGTNIYRALTVRANRVEQVAIQPGAVAFGRVKVAAAFKSGDYAGVFNGGTVLTTSQGNGGGAMVVGVDRLLIGSLGLGANYWNGNIRALRYYPIRLPNDTLQALTT